MALCSAQIVWAEGPALCSNNTLYCQLLLILAEYGLPQKSLFLQKLASVIFSARISTAQLPLLLLS